MRRKKLKKITEIDKLKKEIRKDEIKEFFSDYKLALILMGFYIVIFTLWGVTSL